MSEKRDVKGLLKALAHRSHDTRLAAIQACGELKVMEARPHLVQLLLSENTLLRNAAAFALHAILFAPPQTSPKDKLPDQAQTPESDVSLLLDRLCRTSDLDLQEQSKRALVALGSQAVTHIVNRLRDEELNPLLKIKLIEALGYIGDSRATDALLRLTRGDLLDVQVAAARSLVMIDNPDADEILIPVVDQLAALCRQLGGVTYRKFSDLPALRRQLLLRKLGHENRIDDFIVQLLIHLLDDSEESLRQPVEAVLAATLATKKEILPRVRDSLRGLLAHSSNSVRLISARLILLAKDDELSQALCESILEWMAVPSELPESDIADLLGFMTYVCEKGSSDLILSLQQRLLGLVHIHPFFGEALGKLRPQPEFLIGCFTSSRDYLFRSRLLYALGSVGDDKSIDFLLNCLDDILEPVRVAAIEALGQSKSERGVPRLVDLLLNCFDAKVVRSLVEIGPKALQHAAVAIAQRGEPHSNSKSLIAMGISGSEPLLTTILWETADTEIALCLLNCGNPTLVSAATEWATKNGYTISRTYGRPEVVWASRAS